MSPGVLSDGHKRKDQTVSIATFDSVRDTNVKNIRKGLAGAVFVKPWDAADEPIVKVYTTAGGLTLPADYEDVGYLSKGSSLKVGRETSTSDVESWGESQPTRRDVTTDITTIQFTMQESKRVAFELHSGADLSQVTPDADKNIVMDKPRRPTIRDYRMYVLQKDGDGADAIYWLDWLPLCNVTGVEDLESSQESERAYTVTMTGRNDDAVGTAHRQVWGGPGINPTAMGFPAPTP